MKLACASVMLIVMGAISLASCSDDNAIRGRTIDKQEGKLAIAMITEDGGGGATVPSVQRVYIGQVGTAVETLKAIHARNLAISWSGDRRLAIHMTCGEVLAFTNVVDIYSVGRNSFQRIEIELNANGLCSESWPPGPQ